MPTAPALCNGVLAWTGLADWGTAPFANTVSAWRRLVRALALATEAEDFAERGATCPFAVLVYFLVNSASRLRLKLQGPHEQSGRCPLIFRCSLAMLLAIAHYSTKVLNLAKASRRFLSASMPTVSACFTTFALTRFPTSTGKTPVATITGIRASSSCASISARVLAFLGVLFVMSVTATAEC